jgi:hypothetical protein
VQPAGGCVEGGGEEGGPEGVAVVVKVATALRRELRAMESVKDSTLASSALALAKMLDEPGTAATARVVAARELRETLAVLRERAEPGRVDRMTEFERRRDERQALRRAAQ